MKRIDFEAYLATKYHAIGIIRPAVNPESPIDPVTKKIKVDGNGNPLPSDFHIRQSEGFSFYQIGTYDMDDDVIIRGVIAFQVQDEGLPSETVYWAEKKDPEFVTRPADEAVKIMLTNWYKDPANRPVEIQRFEITKVNIGLQFAEAEVYEVVGEVIVKGRVFIQKNGATITATKMG